jgi:mRNA interferase MazF
VRGAVHRLRSDRSARGHEQTGLRYAVVLQASRFDLLSRWIVAPTSSSARPMVVRPDVDWGAGPTRVLCDALTAVDPGVRLGEHVGHLTHDEQEQVDLALALLLDRAPPGTF